MVKITKVSIIVPVYNVENYLERCVDSLLNQTLKDIQIVLVNDGSTDGSLSLCQSYANKDDRIIVVDKSNGGVSSARNAGIQAAKGEYIGFVDPDDWIEPNMYESMYTQIQEDKSDICVCNYVMERDGVSIPITLDIEEAVLIKEDIIHKIALDTIGVDNFNSNLTVTGKVQSIWRLLINKKLILDNNLTFPLNVPLMEDIIFCLQVLLKSKKISINRGLFYHYMNDRTDSAINVYRKNLNDIQLKVFNIIRDIIIQENIYDIAKNRLNIRYLFMAVNSIMNEVHFNNKISIWQKYKNVHRICIDQKLKMIVTAIDTKGYSLRKKLLLKSIKHEFTIFVFTYYYLLCKFKVLILKLMSKKYKN